MRRKRMVLVAGLCAGYGVIVALLIILLVFFADFRTETRRRLDEVEMRVEDQAAAVRKETGELIVKHDQGVNNLLRGVEENTQNELSRQNRAITALQNSVRQQTNKTGQIEKTFGDILTEQQKQHIGTVAQDAALKQKLNDAKKLFAEKDYRSSRAIFSEIASYQKDNYEAQFYAAYTLFLINPMDTAVYGRVLDAFTRLEQNGFTRSEMNEVRAFIGEENVVFSRRKGDTQ